MAQSLSRMYTHLIFSTKFRSGVLNDEVREPLNRYVAAVLNNNQCHTVLVNSVEDHIHLLFDLGRTVALSKIVQEVKTSSSHWIKTQGPGLQLFSWQNGYGAFACDASSLYSVREYVANQNEHHLTETFKDEFRRLLVLNGIEFDERYVWD